jgi:hypothetical protein
LPDTGDSVVAMKIGPSVADAGFAHGEEAEDLSDFAGLL